MTALIISIAGAVIAFLATALCGVLAFMGKFALATLDKRIDDAKARLVKVEENTSIHANTLASVKTQTEAEDQRFEDLRLDLREVRSKLDNLVDAIGDLNVEVRRKGTPMPFPRPYPDRNK